jgi:hypothetical protein
MLPFLYRVSSCEGIQPNFAVPMLALRGAHSLIATECGEDCAGRPAAKCIDPSFTAGMNEPWGQLERKFQIICWQTAWRSGMIRRVAYFEAACRLFEQCRIRERVARKLNNLSLQLSMPILQTSEFTRESVPPDLLIGRIQAGITPKASTNALWHGCLHQQPALLVEAEGVSFAVFPRQSDHTLNRDTIYVVVRAWLEREFLPPRRGKLQESGEPLDFVRKRRPTIQQPVPIRPTNFNAP